MQTTYLPSRTHHLLFAAACALAMSFASASVFAGSWFGNETVKGNGVVKKQERALPHFTAIELSLPAQVEVRIGTTESVTIETDENLLPLVAAVVEKGALQLRPAKRDMSLRASTMKIVVNAKEISDLSIGGSGSISADTLRSPKLSLAIGGGGSISVKSVQAEALDASIGGSGEFKLGGAVRTVTFAIGGSGNVQARLLKADAVVVSIGGSGSATVWAVDSLSASIAGAGNVSYYGDPQTSSSIVGLGSVKRRGAVPQ